MPLKIDQFVPLVPTMPAAESREFQITIIPQGEQAQSFQNSAPAGGDPASPHKHGGPTLSLQRDNGGRITRIKIQCNCGQLIEVECVYQEAGKGMPAAKTAEAPKAAESPKAAEPPKVAEASKAKAPPKAEKAKEKPKEAKASKGRK
jgi:hypothetical protein